LSRNRRNKRDKRLFINIYSKHLKIVIPTMVVIICVIVLGIKIAKTNLAKNDVEAFNSEVFSAELELTEEEKEVIKEETKRDVTLSITVTGNILCENSILNYVKNNNYDFANVFDNIKKHTNSADITIVPIETNFVNKNFSGSGLYNSPKELAKNIKDIGGDIVFTSNNHSVDYGIDGIKETITNLNESGLENVGTKINEGNSNILIKEYRNIKIAFLSYTYGTNKKENGYEKFVNITNKETMQRDINNAKQQGAEYIIAGMHWGNVTGSKLNENQKELSEFLVNSGVDVILGNHPSSIQKMETRVNSEGKDVLVVYSLGNFIGDAEGRNSDLGMILNLELIKLTDDDKVYLNRVTYVPTYIQDNGINSVDRYKILDIKEEISNFEKGIRNIDGKTYNKLKQGLVKIKELING